jgi:uncharacterized protein (DUF488 family)
MTLYTTGYGRWPTKQRLERLVRALRAAGVTTLVDIRHSPCPSNLDPASNYGPRDWHLLEAGRGLDGHLRRAGIDYLWLVELGNPQKTDPAMAVLRAHVAAADEAWPVNRGLAQLHQLVLAEGERVALLCACKDYDDCHRKVIAEALSQRFFGGALAIRELAR